MDANVDCGVLELDLATTVLELELRPDPHEIAHARVREQVESLRLEPGFVALAVHALPPRVRLRVATDRRAPTETRQIRFVVHASPDERPLDRIARRRGVALRRGG